MSLVRLITNYSAYNEWATNEIVNWLAKLDTDLLSRKTPSSYPSLDFTVQHILRAQTFWLAFICGEDTSKLNWSVRAGEAKQILAELQDNSTEMKLRFAAFSEADLLQHLNLNMPWAKNKLARYEYIMHVVNHSSYHRGQLVSMARNLGIESGIPVTDYNIFNCLS